MRIPFTAKSDLRLTNCMIQLTRHERRLIWAFLALLVVGSMVMLARKRLLPGSMEPPDGEVMPAFLPTDEEILETEL